MQKYLYKVKNAIWAQKYLLFAIIPPMIFVDRIISALTKTLGTLPHLR